jgi:glycolate oxidase
MADLEARLSEIVGPQHVLVGDAVGDDYTHDEALTATPVRPLAVVRPDCAADVAAIVRVCDEMRVPITARGAGTGLSGACTPREDGIVLALERMNEILEIDTENYVAVVQPGVSLDQLDAALAPHGLVYPVCPGENSASLGGNVATNAGGMRAVIGTCISSHSRTIADTSAVDPGRATARGRTGAPVRASSWV